MFIHSDYQTSDYMHPPKHFASVIRELEACCLLLRLIASC